jgi:hypothetical protein
MRIRELARRSDSGILVRLLWDAATGQTLIRYRDRRTGERFTAEVPAPCALEAFRHPNAYRPSTAPASIPAYA